MQLHSGHITVCDSRHDSDVHLTHRRPGTKLDRREHNCHPCAQRTLHPLCVVFHTCMLEKRFYFEITEMCKNVDDCIKSDCGDKGLCRDLRNLAGNDSIDQYVCDGVSGYEGWQRGLTKFERTSTIASRPRL